MTELTEFSELKEADPKFDLPGQVIGLAMRVHRNLGHGFAESVYKRALQHELTKAGHTANLEQPLRVLYDGIVVGDFYADLIVDEELIVEAKAVQALVKAHEVQLVNYLMATGKNEGLLLNFGTKSLEFHKKFRSPAQPSRIPPSLH